MSNPLSDSSLIRDSGTFGGSFGSLGLGTAAAVGGRPASARATAATVSAMVGFGRSGERLVMRRQ
jgi:hypothetical protein